MPTLDRLGLHVARTENRVVRPRDLEYQDATLALRRLVERGALRRFAHGYYLVPPDTHRGVRPWNPQIEAVALGIAVADYGRDAVALMGISAARLRGAPPRALATAVVAIPKSNRPDLHTELGTICFVSRDTNRLDLERARTEVVEGWTTTPEQTVLDLAARPSLGGVSPATASEVITQLAAECDWQLVVRLGTGQRRTAALARASWLASAVREVEGAPARRPVPSLGLRSLGTVGPSGFGVVA